LDIKADLKQAEESYVKVGEELNRLTTEAKRLEGVVLYLRAKVKEDEEPKCEVVDAEKCEECKTEQ